VCEGLFVHHEHYNESRCPCTGVLQPCTLLLEVTFCHLFVSVDSKKENNWFLGSCSWPCEPADLESRTRVLLRLAEKTSLRDTLEVLCNLPGLKEPNGEIALNPIRHFICIVPACSEKLKSLMFL